MAIWYFGQGGAVGNTGASFAQRKALHSQLTLANGDTVYMCAAAAGAANRFNMTERLLLSVSGVTYHVFTDHYIVVNATSPVQDDAAIEAVGKNNITIEPDAGFLQLGDPTGSISGTGTPWQPNPASGSYNAETGGGYTCDRQFYFEGCTNIRLIGRWTGAWPDDAAVSNFKVFGARRYLAHQFDQNCDLYEVDSVDFGKHGTNNTNGASTSGVHVDWGNGPVFSGSRGYVHRCRLGRCGHAPYASCRSFVMDDCVADGDWSAFTVNDDAGRGAPIERSGQRCFSMTGGNIDNDDFGGGLSPYGPQMMQFCIMKNAGSAGDDSDNCQTEIYGNHEIVRFNYFWDGCNDAFRAGIFGDFVGQYFPAGSVNYQKCYHNTIYANGGMFQFRNASSPFTPGCFKQIDVLNNIFDELRGTYWGSYGRSFGGGVFGEFAPARWTVDATDREGYPNNWKGGRFAGNLIKNWASSPDGATIYVNDRSADSGGSIFTLAQIQTSFPANWYNNTNSSPTYVGTPGSGTRTKAAFAPNGGLAVGNAEPLAIANNAGPGTTLSVQSGQARTLFDGWDMESLGLEADWIVIRNATTGVFGTPVQIQQNGIDYPNDDIVLSASRPWSSGDEIHLALTPDGVNFTNVADIGAGQTAGATIPATGVAGYRITKGLGDGNGQVIPQTFELIDVGDVLTYQFTGLTPGQEYYFRVQAYDEAGNYGPTTARLFVTTNP